MSYHTHLTYVIPRLSLEADSLTAKVSLGLQKSIHHNQDEHAHQGIVEADHDNAQKMTTTAIRLVKRRMMVTTMDIHLCHSLQAQ